jgi:hypothetical protein
MNQDQKNEHGREARREMMLIISDLLISCTHDKFLDPFYFARELHKLQDLILDTPRRRIDPRTDPKESK